MVGESGRHADEAIVHACVQDPMRMPNAWNWAEWKWWIHSSAWRFTRGKLVMTHGDIMRK